MVVLLKLNEAVKVSRGSYRERKRVEGERERERERVVMVANVRTAE